MSRYLVTLRGFAEQHGHVTADSAAEGREKTRRAELDGALGPVGWGRDLDRYPESLGWARWPASVVVERVGD